MNGTDHAVIVNMQMSVEGLAYDAMSDKLFWTSNNDASIRSIDIGLIGHDYENNTNYIKQVIQLNPNDKPRGMHIFAVYPLSSRVSISFEIVWPLEHSLLLLSLLSYRYCY